MFCLFTALFVSVLVGKPKDRVAHNEANIFQMITEFVLFICFVKIPEFNFNVMYDIVQDK